LHGWHERGHPPWVHAMRGRRGWLRPLILSLLLNKGSLNGVEIMDEIQRLTGGLWRPSPGSVYPMLAEMLEEGLVVRRPDGRYELSEAGRALAQSVLPPPPDPLAALREAVDYVERLAESEPTALRQRLAEIRSLRERLEAVERRLSSTA